MVILEENAVVRTRQESESPRKNYMKFSDHQSITDNNNCCFLSFLEMKKRSSITNVFRCVPL